MDAQNLKPHRGTLILILGILGIFCCGIFTAIPAIIMGSGDLKAMDAGTMDPAGRGNTNAGKICGIIGCVLSVLGIVVQIILRGFRSVSPNPSPRLRGGPDSAKVPPP